MLSGGRLCGRLVRAVHQQALLCRYKATAAAPKPFTFQDILDFETKPELPWKKLSGKSISQTGNLISFLYIDMQIGLNIER